LCSESEHARQQALADLESYKESIRTKEELIVRLTAGVDPALLRQYEQCDVAVEVGDGGARTSVRRHGNSGGSNNRASINETRVTDTEQLRDLVVGFETQNQFLNQEVLGGFKRALAQGRDHSVQIYKRPSNGWRDRRRIIRDVASIWRRCTIS
jgi:hypothetical protein